MKVLEVGRRQENRIENPSLNWPDPAGQEGAIAAEKRC